MPLRGLPSAFETECGPLVQTRILAKNMFFLGFITSPYCQDHPAVVGGILDSSGFTAIYDGLEFAGLHYVARFESKRPGDDSQ